ncbi:MAG: diguanylate cyclase [Myxococcota bacterium]
MLPERADAEQLPTSGAAGEGAAAARPDGNPPASAEVHPAECRGTVAAPGARSVLVADADAELCRLLAVPLQQAGYTTCSVASGEEVLQRCRQDPPDVVLLDLGIPGRNALEVLRVLKAEPRLALIPVVLLNGAPSDAGALEGLRRGAHDFLPKPVRAAELVARVQAADRTKALLDRLRQRNHELLTQASTDQLTGCYNRRFLEQVLRNISSIARRHRRPFCAVMLDVDHFKDVNDTYGHCAGDLVLSEIARRLRGRLRSGDVLGRWGGEEFLLLTPETQEHGAAELAESLRREVAEHPVPHGDERIGVTISVGWAQWRDDSPEGLVARADHNLYVAKRRGRNCVHGDLNH